MGTVGTAPWKQLLLNTLESNSSLKHSSFFQLATIGSNGRPSNRTVVFRRFQENSDKIQINTNCRSHKVDDLKHCPFAEINGRIEVVDRSCPDSEVSGITRREVQLNKERKLGLLVLQNQDCSTWGLILVFRHYVKNQPRPVDAFCLLVLDPDQVDYLNLKINEMLTFTSEQSTNGEKFWTSERVNP